MQLSGKIAAAAGLRGNAVVCIEKIGPGEAILRIQGPQLRVPGTYTVQRGDADHISGDGATWAFLNHACAPNSAIDFSTWELTTRRTIRAGEEITYNYLTTEWDMASPFACGCGAAHCPGTIRGFRHLDAAQRQAIGPLLSPFLRKIG